MTYPVFGMLRPQIWRSQCQPLTNNNWVWVCALAYLPAADNANSMLPRYIVPIWLQYSDMDFEFHSVIETSELIRMGYMFCSIVIPCSCNSAAHDCFLFLCDLATPGIHKGRNCYRSFFLNRSYWEVNRGSSRNWWRPSSPDIYSINRIHASLAKWSIISNS